MVTKQKPSDPGALERQRVRQVRTMRKRKAGAIAAVALIGATALVFALASQSLERRTTVGTQATSAQVQVATRFMKAYGSLDADQTIRYLADDATISPLIAWIGAPPVGTAALRLSMAWLDATGFEMTLHSCTATSSAAFGDMIRCTYGQHLLRSHEIGRGPYGPAHIDLTVRDGKVVRIASVYFDYMEAFNSEAWEPFAQWVSSARPKDAARMYVDDTYRLARLTPSSIRLWRRYTERWVETVSG